ncbi:hypothetical protein IFM47457_01216 [Aspergillus lentulus]|nr:hypothetical protein IFM47457_01216 [Aspergillus lentulus]
MRVTRVTEEPRGRIQAQTETGGQRKLGAEEDKVRERRKRRKTENMMEDCCKRNKSREGKEGRTR